jgi:outer membrane protein assembly factor BamA
MSSFIRSLFLIFLGLLCGINLYGQGWEPSKASQDEEIRISSIEIFGNVRTRDKIIIRELDFQEGDIIQLRELTKRLKSNQEFIMNTSLFANAKINIKNWAEGDMYNEVDIHISLTEAWYVYPIPIFELADRNFNVWWGEQRKQLNRVNIGARLIHRNLTGNDDRLKFVAHTGYTRKLELQYISPIINHSKTFRILTDLFYATNKEVSYTTLENKQQFFRNDNQALMKRRRIGMGLQFRPKIRTRHLINATYYNNSVVSVVSDSLNFDFLLDGRDRQQFIELSYSLSIDHRDIAPYPLSGALFTFNINKQGLGFFGDHSFSSITLGVDHYHSLTSRWSIANSVKGRLALEDKKTAFYTYRALGYNSDFLRGYELYVVDGNHFLYNRASLRFEILNRNLNLGKLVPLNAFRQLPLRLYVSLYNDLGFVNDPFYNEGNPISNELLWGVGLGVDFVIYFDKIISFQLSRNHLNEIGLFLHFEFAL